MARNAFDKYGLEQKDKLSVELLEQILEQMIEMNEKFDKLLGARIAPSG